MARPKVLSSTKFAISTALNAEDLEALEKLTTIKKISRSKLMRTAIREYLASAATVTAA